MDHATQDISAFFEQANDFIDSQRQQMSNVLVHCYVGVSRSATVIVAYLMWRFGLSFHNAFNDTRNKRPYINPNPGFLQQLCNYEVHLIRQTQTEPQPITTTVRTPRNDKLRQTNMIANPSTGLVKKNKNSEPITSVEPSPLKESITPSAKNTRQKFFSNQRQTIATPLKDLNVMKVPMRGYTPVKPQQRLGSPQYVPQSLMVHNQHLRLSQHPVRPTPIKPLRLRI